MFQGLFKRAENTIDQLVAKYVGRAAVAIPLLVAVGFATAALTVELTARYGAVTSYTAMAALFAVVGLVIMAFTETGITGAAPSEPAAASDDDSSDTPAADDSQAASLFPPEMLSILTSAAPAALPGLARGIGRNLPLIFILAVLAYIVSHFAGSGEEAASAGEQDQSSSPPPEAPPAEAA